eukprot:gene3863-4467_t
MLSIAMLSKDMFRYVADRLFTTIKMRICIDNLDVKTSKIYRSFCHPYSPLKRIERLDVEYMLTGRLSDTKSIDCLSSMVASLTRLSVMNVSQIEPIIPMIPQLQHLQINSIGINGNNYLALRGLPNLSTFYAGYTYDWASYNGSTLGQYLEQQTTITSLALRSYTLTRDELSQILTSKTSITSLQLYCAGEVPRMHKDMLKKCELRELEKFNSGLPNHSQPLLLFLKINKDAPELVFLCGPPCSGKTFHYYQNYKDTHQRILMFNFLPAGGELQLKWANTWAHAERSLATAEGYDYIKHITTPLMLNTHNASTQPSLTNSALFVDARLLLQFSVRQSTVTLPPNTLKFKYSVQPIDNTEHALREWAEGSSSSASQRRIIVFVDEVQLFPACLDLVDAVTREHYRKEIRRCIKTLSDRVGLPVYYLVVPPSADPENDFYRLPNLGVFAWAQIRHRLSLASSIVVLDDADNSTFLTTAPLKIIVGSKFFQQSAYTVDTRISKNIIDNIGSLPGFLENIQFVNYDTVAGYSPERGLPLFDRAHANVNERSTVEECLPNEKRHGVYFPKDTSMADVSTQQQMVAITDIATISPPLSQVVAKEDKPLHYVTTEFMLEFGIDELSVRRGEAYYLEKRLAHVNVNALAPDYSSPSIVVTADCTGTSDSPYLLMARFRCKGDVAKCPILETQCSCPNGAKTYGKCKHIVTLILHCNQHLADQPEPSPKSSPAKNSVNRTLPAWMSNSPGAKTMSTNEYKKISPNKRTMNLYFPSDNKHDIDKMVNDKKEEEEKEEKVEFLVPRTSSEEQLLSFIQKDNG